MPPPAGSAHRGTASCERSRRRGADVRPSREPGAEGLYGFPQCRPRQAGEASRACVRVGGPCCMKMFWTVGVRGAVRGAPPRVTRMQAGSCTLLILRSLWTFCIHFDFYKYRIEILCSSVEVGEWAPPDAVPQPPAGGRLAPAASPCPRHTESPVVRSPHLPAEPGGGDRTAGQWPGHFQQ